MRLGIAATIALLVIMLNVMLALGNEQDETVIPDPAVCWMDDEIVPCLTQDWEWTVAWPTATPGPISAPISAPMSAPLLVLPDTSMQP